MISLLHVLKALCQIINFITDAPAVEPLPEHIYSGLGLQEILTCTVHSSPRAEVIWTRDGLALDNNMMGVHMHQESNRHILTLDLENQDMFGDYKCQASNELGSAHSSVTITGNIDVTVRYRSMNSAEKYCSVNQKIKFWLSPMPVM